MTDVLTEVADKIRSELDVVNDEIKRLEAALVHLGPGVREPSPRAAAKPRRRRGGGSRAKRGQRQAELLAAIKAEPGRRPSEYARKLGIADSQVHPLLKKLVAEKKIIRNVKDGIQPLPF